MRCVVSCGSTSFPWLVFFGALLCGSMIRKCKGRWMWQGSASVHLGTERNTPIIPNWFQPCQCCCCLCNPGGYLRQWILISYDWAQVLEACDCLKLLSIYFDLCVDATGKWWWCINVSFSVTQNDWFAIFKVRVTVKMWLLLPYFFNCWTGSGANKMGIHW